MLVFTLKVMAIFSFANGSPVFFLKWELPTSLILRWPYVFVLAFLETIGLYWVLTPTVLLREFFPRLTFETAPECCLFNCLGLVGLADYVPWGATIGTFPMICKFCLAIRFSFSLYCRLLTCYSYNFSFWTQRGILVVVCAAIIWIGRNCLNRLWFWAKIWLFSGLAPVSISIDDFFLPGVVFLVISRELSWTRMAVVGTSVLFYTSYMFSMGYYWFLIAWMGSSTVVSPPSCC